MTFSVELFQSSGIRVVDHRCASPKGGCGCVVAESSSHVTLARRGCFNAHVGRRQWLVSADAAFLYRAGVEFRVAHPVEGGDDCTLIHLPEDLLDEVFGAAGADQGLLETRSSASLTLSHASLLGMLSDPTADQFECEEAVLGVLGHVGPRAVGAGGHSQRVVARAREAVHEDLSRNLSMAALSAECGVSSFHLMRLFRRQTGMTIRGYRRRLRAREACFQIAGGARSLTDVALACGFASHSHMADTIRQELGVQPRRIRREGLN